MAVKLNNIIHISETKLHGVLIYGKVDDYDSDNTVNYSSSRTLTISDPNTSEEIRIKAKLSSDVDEVTFSENEALLLIPTSFRNANKFDSRARKNLSIPTATVFTADYQNDDDRDLIVCIPGIQGAFILLNESNSPSSVKKVFLSPESPNP